MKLGPRFDDAPALAAELHRTPLRKSTEIPYVSHLLGVAVLVLEDGGTEDEAIAALLHDSRLAGPPASFLRRANSMPFPAKSTRYLLRGSLTGHAERGALDLRLTARARLPLDRAD